MSSQRLTTKRLVRDGFGAPLTDADESKNSARTPGIVVGVVFTLVMLGANLPAPLYGLWGAEFGFGALTTTILFSAYALGIVVALVAFAPLSDQAGRRPLLLITLILAALSTALFIVADGVAVLFVARLLSGLATGVGTATATSALTDLLGDRSKLARALPAAANLGGLGLGPIAAGLLAQDATHPTTVVFWIYLATLGVVGPCLFAVPETVRRPRLPQLRLRKPMLPKESCARRAFVAATAYMCAAFAVSGLFGSLVPSFLRADLGQRNLAIVGLIVGLLFLVSMATQTLRVITRRRGNRWEIPFLLITGVALIEGGLLGRQLPVFVAGTVVSGVGLGLATLNGVGASQRLADDDHRARLTATLFIAAYTGISVSAIGVGVLEQAVGEHAATLVMTTAVVAGVLAAARLQRAARNTEESSTDRPRPASRPAGISPDAEQAMHPTGFGTVTGVPDLPPTFHERFTSRHVDVDGVKLHIVTGGSGPAVLLVGGWPQFWWEWRYVMEPLAEDHTVIAVDPRGIGRSERPDNGYDTGTVAHELHRLMNILGHDRFDVVGHDIGMWIAYAMAADQPSPISRLVLIDAALPGISAAPSALPDTRQEVDATWHFLFNRLAAINEHLIEGREEAYLDAQFLIKGATAAAMPRDTIDVYLKAQRQPGALRGSLSYYRALDETIIQNRARARTHLRMPVLAIGGATSRGDVIAADALTVADSVTAVTIPHCGHYVPEEAPDELLAAVRPFLTTGASAELEPRVEPAHRQPAPPPPGLGGCHTKVPEGRQEQSRCVRPADDGSPDAA